MIFFLFEEEMAESNQVTTSGSGSSTRITTPFHEFRLPLQVTETMNAIENVTSSSMPGKVPHLSIQKRFYKRDKFEHAVKSIQEGHHIESLWHYCTNQELTLIGNGKKGSEVDCRVPMTADKFIALSEKYDLRANYHVIQTIAYPRIVNDEQVIEICYPLCCWFIFVRGSEKITENYEITADSLPLVFPHAAKMLGQRSITSMMYLYQSMQDLQQSIDYLRHNHSYLTEEHGEEIHSSFRFLVVDLPLTQDPIIVTFYDNLPDCDGEKCREFGRSGIFDGGNWLISYTY